MQKTKLPLLFGTLMLAATMLAVVPALASDGFTFVALPPISNRDFFYGGSTIPIKFQLFDSNGNVISNATATIFVNGEAATPGRANTGNTFTFDPSDQQYIYHLNTKTLPVPEPNVITIYVNGVLEFTKSITLH